MFEFNFGFHLQQELDRFRSRLDRVGKTPRLQEENQRQERSARCTTPSIFGLFSHIDLARIVLFSVHHTLSARTWISIDSLHDQQ
jgi:hypothetical protein